MKTTISLEWSGTFIEHCKGRINRTQGKLLEKHQQDLKTNFESGWYENTQLLQSIFKQDNWWAVDDLDHAMGFVFHDRPAMERELSGITCKIDGTVAKIDPEEFNLSFYAPEPMPPLEKHDQVVCHGCLRQAKMSLPAEIEGPLDPSMITLSFINFSDIGLVLIDMDIDGHDELEFTWGETTYLQPRFLRNGEKAN
jgi:hypothetical protein